MQTDDSTHRNHLPQVGKKPQTIHGLFDLIKQKKAEFLKSIQDIQVAEPSLPHINHQRRDTQNSSDPSNNHVDHLADSRQFKTTEESSYKYKTILDSKMERKSQKKPIQDNSLILSRKQNILEAKNKINRTKTQFRPVDARKLTSNTSGTKEEDHSEQAQAAKKRFFVTVQQIPRSMKQRNQENLSESISCLQTFNPFFFRNQKIVNICLLKMGKILLRDSPYQLYKTGQQLSHFYIILAGKVKILDGSVKRVCQTGETILEEVLFSDKHKKVALQRARVIGPTYLLQLQLEEYGKLKEQLVRYGLKQSFQEMEAIIKRNYIIKNWMRNKRR